MFDQILENFRRAADSTLQAQQMMLKTLTTQWPQLPAALAPTSGLTEKIEAAQKKFAETVTDMLNKHRESLDSQYRAGIKTIESAFKAAEAKDPAQFRKLTEELWRQSFECLKTASEAQMRDVQDAMQKAFEIASQGAAGVNVKV